MAPSPTATVRWCLPQPDTSLAYKAIVPKQGPLSFHLFWFESTVFPMCSLLALRHLHWPALRDLKGDLISNSQGMTLQLLQPPGRALSLCAWATPPYKKQVLPAPISLFPSALTQSPPLYLPPINLPCELCYMV